MRGVYFCIKQTLSAYDPARETHPSHTDPLDWLPASAVAHRCHGPRLADLTLCYTNMYRIDKVGRYNYCSLHE